MDGRSSKKRIDTEGRECSKCGTYKPWSDYFKKVGAPNGHATECKECRSIYTESRKAQRQDWLRDWRKRNPEKQRQYQVAYNYGLTAPEYLALVELQNDLCAACGKPETALFKGVLRVLCVDHRHVDNKVRGLLCNACNRAIGYAQEDPDRLEACAAYLRRTSSDC